MSPRLILISRQDCHLCDEMRAALVQFRGRYDFEVQVVDVDRDPALEERWGDKVPVLLDGDREICRYFLDHAAVEARLGRMK